MATTKDVPSPAITKVLPVLPLRDVVAFPGLLLPLVIRDEASIRLIDDAVADDKQIAIFHVKNPETQEATKEDISTIGTAAVVLKLLRFPDGSLRFLCQSLSRIKRVDFSSYEPYYKAECEYMDEIHGDSSTEEALSRMIKELFSDLTSLMGNNSDELNVAVSGIFESARLSDMIVSNLNIPSEKKQAFLEEVNVEKRLRRLTTLLKTEIEVLRLTQSLKKETTGEIEKTQKEYYLRQQMKTIQKQLGMDEGQEELNEQRERIYKANLPDYVLTQAEKQLDRLSKMNPSSSEYSVTLTYIEWLIEVPWNKETDDRIDVEEASVILDRDHYDLKDAKERILEFLSVLKLNPLVKSPILLLIGPPAVGKTSHGRSIASAMGRIFFSMSLGGLKDEAEIRGHRRTYVGALPGRIVQGLKTSGSKNPVFMLDEIDKIGQDFRGDPASALLEVLDPEQNGTFSDNYLEVPFDLSKVLFIATANYLDPIPSVLLDRMEMIRIPGYTRYDKLHIAKKYIIPKQLTNNGLIKDGTPLLSCNDPSISTIIDSYTRESGLRNLERNISSVCRKVARKIVTGQIKSEKLLKNSVEDYLGPAIYLTEEIDKKLIPGVAVGLAWTQYGGHVLLIEATRMRGKGSLRLTGSLGKVMQESAETAMSYLRSAENKTGIKMNVYDYDIHIHVPEGATPKDGPSAGISIALQHWRVFSQEDRL